MFTNNAILRINSISWELEVLEVLLDGWDINVLVDYIGEGLIY